MRYLTIKEYADQMSLSQSTVRRMCADGRLACFRCGRIVRIREDAVPQEVELKISRLTGGQAQAAVAMLRGVLAQ